MAKKAQVSLDDELYARAERRAEARGLSVEEYIRELVAEALPERNPGRRADISVIFGLGDSGRTDIGRDKHHLIGEAFDAARREN